MSKVVSREVASGMLVALMRDHSCTNMQCKKAVTRGDGSVVILKCPYEQLGQDLASNTGFVSHAARKTIQTMYANEAKAAMGDE